MQFWLAELRRQKEREKKEKKREKKLRHKETSDKKESKFCILGVVYDSPKLVEKVSPASPLTFSLMRAYFRILGIKYILI